MQEKSDVITLHICDSGEVLLAGARTFARRSIRRIIAPTTIKPITTEKMLASR
jgi:hypothetical protein